MSRRNTRNTRNIPVLSPYSSEDYDSNDGMLTTVWGPGMWHFLHTTSFNYPVNPTAKQKRDYLNFVLSLRNVLPCGKCRKNLTKNLRKLPLTMRHMKSRDSFSRYMYALHEHVNKMLHKDSGLTFEEVRERYEHFRARCAKSITRRRINKKKENGCTESLYGEKSKCILKIVPDTKKCETLQIDNKCVKRRLT
jgi:hypothetical protein